jgi:hypothetical protein
MPGGGQYFGHTEFEEPGPDSPAARTALRPILMAERSSRFRILDVVCAGPKNHLLARVYRTPQGPTVVGVGPITEVTVARDGGVYDTYDPDGRPVSIDWEYDTKKRRRGNRQQLVCCFLADLTGRPVQAVRVQCRCQTADIWGPWFTGRIQAGRRRVVFDGESGAHRVVSRGVLG